ncbi:hypothetical protein BC834DRAFT_884672, partial [Gloeopeniophorella convolvens]
MAQRDMEPTPVIFNDASRLEADRRREARTTLVHIRDAIFSCARDGGQQDGDILFPSFAPALDELRSAQRLSHISFEYYSIRKGMVKGLRRRLAGTVIRWDDNTETESRPVDPCYARRYVTRIVPYGTTIKGPTLQPRPSMHENFLHVVKRRFAHIPNLPPVKGYFRCCPFFF